MKRTKELTKTITVTARVREEDIPMLEAARDLGFSVAQIFKRGAEEVVRDANLKTEVS
jgi:hypothetical protein